MLTISSWLEAARSQAAPARAFPEAAARASQTRQSAVVTSQPAPRPTSIAVPSRSDDLSREVYCVLGVPVDAVEMPEVLRRISAAAAERTPFLISAPNLNSLVISRADKQFRESLVQSDICTADGMAVVWLARLAGVPIKSRIAGSDIFDALKTQQEAADPLRIFLFGGPQGVAEAAARALNSRPSGVRCVGWLYPGYCSAEEMSRADVISAINSTGADFLVAALGNQKGQLWLLRNHRRLRIPVRAHLGATLNFQAGTVKRAPPIMRKLGLEWLWRIKEEPYLWKRYWNDGSVLVRLLLTHLLPLAFWNWSMRLGAGNEDLVITEAHDSETVTLSLRGPADSRHIDKAIAALRAAVAGAKHVVIDFSNAHSVDSRFLGLLLMLEKTLGSGGGEAPVFVGLSPTLKKVFRLNGLAFREFEAAS